jgi:hypothetical protein
MSNLRSDNLSQKAQVQTQANRFAELIRNSNKRLVSKIVNAK